MYFILIYGGKNDWLTVKKYDDMIKYYLNKKLHCNDGPAQIWYYYGNILAEKYCINGKRYRKNKSAYID